MSIAVMDGPGDQEAVHLKLPGSVEVGLTRAQAAELRERITCWQRENRKARRRTSRPTANPATHAVSTTWPPDPTWGTDAHGRFHYRDYDGESLHVWHDKDGELWVDKHGEGPVFIRREDKPLIASALTLAHSEEAELSAAKLEQALAAGLAIIDLLEAAYPSGNMWADKYRSAVRAALEAS